MKNLGRLNDSLRIGAGRTFDRVHSTLTDLFWPQFDVDSTSSFEIRVAENGQANEIILTLIIQSCQYITVFWTALNVVYNWRIITSTHYVKWVPRHYIPGHFIFCLENFVGLQSLEIKKFRTKSHRVVNFDWTKQCVDSWS